MKHNSDQLSKDIQIHNMEREDILRRPAYWFEETQNELYSQVSEYMKREKINQSQLAERLKVSKGYVSQIMNGDYNFSLKKWITLCVSIGIIPSGYKNLDEVIKEDALKKLSKLNARGIVQSILEKETQIFYKNSINIPFTLVAGNSSHGDGFAIKEGISATKESEFNEQSTAIHYEGQSTVTA